MKFPILAFFPSLLAACAVDDGTGSYYGNGTAPSITGLDVESSLGNVGGDTVVISGSGFGTNAGAVTVVFEDQNAKVLLIDDGSITVEVPRGPLSGGAVDISVGTEDGQDTLVDAYTYELGDLNANEIAYISVTNDFFSCLGGTGSNVDSFCKGWGYSGDAGVEGRAEFLEYQFGRVHSPHLGSRAGFGGNNDQSLDEWFVQVPAQDVNAFDIQDGYEDLRVSVNDFTLTNPLLEGDKWCVDETALAQFRYEGGDLSEEYGVPLPPVTIMEGALGYEGDCSDSWTKKYDLDTMTFCPIEEYDTPLRLEYENDWPVGENFFVGQKDNGQLDDTLPSTIILNVPKIRVDDVPLLLPEYSYFYAAAGSQVSGSSTEQDWSIYSWDSSCPDTDENNVTDLDDSVWHFEWDPTTADLEGHVEAYDAIKDVDTYVRVTVGLLTLGWMGGDAVPIRATITVPEDHNYDEETGRSSISIPAEVFYQFPSVNLDYGVIYDPISGVPSGWEWGDSSSTDYAYVSIVIERVTEYRIAADVDNRKGDLIFAYSTGDFTYTFSGFDNPLDGSGCDNCLDDDGDGWMDDADPDCIEGSVENGSAEGEYTCNDGEDNDGDGLVDAQDPDCEDGTDGETNCSDGEDNDDDGYTDEEDGECAEGGDGIEQGEDSDDWECQDGIDNDEDGWVDFEDPDCENSADDEVGFSDFECNNGIDDDFHGDVDGDDPLCILLGASNPVEQPEMSTECVDGLDNDEDGFVDENDPDCEYPPYAFETDLEHSVEDYPEVAQCYNGEDDDGDGDIDADDLGCENASGDPDGFLNDEGIAR